MSQTLADFFSFSSQVLSLAILLVCAYIATMAWKARDKVKGYVIDTIADLNDPLGEYQYSEREGMIKAFTEFLQCRLDEAYAGLSDNEINKHWALRMQLNSVLNEINNLKIVHGRFVIASKNINGKFFIEFRPGLVPDKEKEN